MYGGLAGKIGDHLDDLYACMATLTKQLETAQAEIADLKKHVVFEQSFDALACDLDQR